jgi:hypothetical protein
MAPRRIVPSTDGAGRRVAIVVSRFNAEIGPPGSSAQPIIKPAIRAEIAKWVDGSSSAGRFHRVGGCSLAFIARLRMSSDGFRLWRHQQATGHVQVRQGKHGQRSLRVLVQPAVAHQRIFVIE